MKISDNVFEQKKPLKSGKRKKNTNTGKRHKVQSHKNYNVKQNKTKKVKSKKTKKKLTRVIAPTNNREKINDLHIMRKHNFMSTTTATQTEIYRMKLDENAKRPNTYIVAKKPHRVSAIMKLTLNTTQSNELSPQWTLNLWNLNQDDSILPKGCYVTFTRIFERRDDNLVSKNRKRRKWLTILSSDSEENIDKQKKTYNHDLQLMKAISSGDSVVGFGGEAIVTAPNVTLLEEAVKKVKNYIESVDEIRGLTYSLDVGRQSNPYLIYGPNDPAGNKGVYTEMTSPEAGISSLFVDSGGDRSYGSEYIGLSVGKLIKSHAAYNFQNNVSLLVGNDTQDVTTTMGGDIKGHSQTYLSKVISRAYLLDGKHVTHFVADSHENALDLMNMPIGHGKKEIADVSDGLLNILEAIDDGNEEHENKNRILSVFPQHINNIITLLSQFRPDGQNISLNDDFANAARDILINFFVTNKYWSYKAQENPDDIRIYGYHDHFKTLYDFGQYVLERKRNGHDIDAETRDAVKRLDSIINQNILPTIPALNTTTKPIIDRLVRMPYRVVDLTGMGSGVRSEISNSSLNMMMLSYLNVLLPSMNNGDVIFIHGVSRMSTIAKIIKNMIESSGINIDVVYTEKNQNAAIEMLNATADTIISEDPVTREVHKVTKNMAIDFTMIDLYKNRTNKLIDSFSMDEDWTKILSKVRSSYFVKTDDSVDYIRLDSIL